jgi:hypothetical protein
MNEPIDVPASQLLDCALGSALHRANAPRGQNILLSVHRSRIGLRDAWANDPLHFLFLAAHKTRAGLRLDCVPAAWFNIRRSKAGAEPVLMDSAKAA